LFDQYPNLEAELIKHVQGYAEGNNVAVFNIRPSQLHHIFISYLNKQNHSHRTWPFTTKYLGIRTITKYMQWLREEHFSRVIHARGDHEAKAHLSVGTGTASFLTFEEPFDAVEIDGYNIDAFLTVGFATPEGTEVDMPLERLWLLAAVERASSAVLAPDRLKLSSRRLMMPGSCASFAHMRHVSVLRVVSVVAFAQNSTPSTMSGITSERMICRRVKPFMALAAFLTVLCFFSARSRNVFQLPDKAEIRIWRIAAGSISDWNLGLPAICPMGSGIRLLIHSTGLSPVSKSTFHVSWSSGLLMTGNRLDLAFSSSSLSGLI